MKKSLEVRWHGRGGQGAKTAALLLADVAFKTGAYVQGFPEYGPERMGAPITAYNRISRNEIRVHSNIYTPDLVVVVDETLLHSVDVTAGLKEDGAIIVNTAQSADEIRLLLHGYKGAVYTVDARQISTEALGKNFPNSPMLAAAVAVSGVMTRETFMSMKNHLLYEAIIILLILIIPPICIAKLTPHEVRFSTLSREFLLLCNILTPKLFQCHIR